MKFSAFVRFGHMSFSGKPSMPEQFYRAISANVAGAFDLTVGTHEEATVFARAHAAARAARTLQRAGNQIDPLKATEILPNLETDFGVIPGPFQDTPSRRRVVSAREKLPSGGTYTSMRAALVSALGTNFLALRLLTGAELANVPASPTTAVETKASRVDVTPKFCKTVDPITDATAAVVYANLDASAGEVDLAVGDVIIIDPSSSAQAERVTVTAVGGSGATRTFTATFTKAHDAGAAVTTMNWPYWWSTRGMILVVVTQVAAQSLEKRRIVDELMAKMTRGVCQWSIVQPAAVGGTTAGPSTLPFVLGSTPLSATTFSLLP